MHAASFPEVLITEFVGVSVKESAKADEFVLRNRLGKFLGGPADFRKVDIVNMCPPMAPRAVVLEGVNVKRCI